MADKSIFKPAFDALATNSGLGKPTGKIAYAYLRVSGDDQAGDGRSGLPRQVMHVHEVAEKHGYHVPWDCVFADDFTGFQFETRPGLTELRKAYKAHNRRAHAVIIEHLDRLSRNADWHQGYLLDEMKQYGIKVHFWQSYASRVERAVMGAVAQDGMEQAKQRMAEGNLHKARSGRVTARVAAYGYKFVDADGNEGTTARKDTYYAVNEEEAAIIRMIFERVIAGQSMRELSYELTQAGVPPPKKSRQWEPTQIRLFIKNEIYKGDFYAHRWKHTTVQKLAEDGITVHTVKRKIEYPREEWIHVSVPQIVSEADWEAANRIILQNKKMSRRNARAPYLLTGLIQCAECGWTYTGTSKKKPKKTYRAYRCPGTGCRPKHAIEQERCPQGSIRCDTIEMAVWKVLCDALLQPELLIDALDNDAASERNKQLQEQITYLEREISQRDGDDERMFRAYLAGAFDEQEFTERRIKLKQEKQNLNEEARRLRDQVISPDQLETRKQEILALSQSIRDMNIPIDPPFDVKRRIIKLLVDTITINVNEGWFTVKGAIVGAYAIGKTHVPVAIMVTQPMRVPAHRP